MHHVHVKIAVLLVTGRPFQVVSLGKSSKLNGTEEIWGAVLFVPHRLCAVRHDGRIHAPVEPEPRSDEAVGARLR